jgi:hypothetical protein
MIISIRGTSGSGKTHLAREVMAQYDIQTPDYISGRKRPIFYALRRKGSRKTLYALGSYETACGGCDTIKTADEVYGLIHRLSQHGHVLFEGLLLSTEVNRALALPKGGALHVFIDLPVEKCLEQVNSRRRQKNPEAEDVAEDNTRSKHRGVQLTYQRLMAGGSRVFKGDYNACRDRIFQELGL